MLPDYSTIAWLLIVFSVYLTGVSKGGFAGGFGTLSVPLMALAISPTQAAGLLLPLLLVMDVFAVKAWWSKHDSAEVWRFVPGLFIGVTVGTLLFGSLSEQGVRLVLGLLSVVFAAYMLLKPVAKKPISSRWALPAASVCGFTSFIAHEYVLNAAQAQQRDLYCYLYDHLRGSEHHQTGALCMAWRGQYDQRLGLAAAGARGLDRRA